MDYYEILGVEHDTSDEQIKKAYHIMLKRYHPDNYKDDSEWARKRIYQLNEAYEILKDPIQRKQYDEKYIQKSSFTETPEENKKEEKSKETENSVSYSRQNEHGVSFFWLSVIICIIVCALYFMPNQMSEYFGDLSNGFEKFINTFR